MKERLREGLLLKFNGKQGTKLAFGYRRTILTSKWEACYMKHYIMKNMGG